MKWIKYQIVQCTLGEENVLVTKKVGYNEAHLAIAQQEAYNGHYEIIEDGFSLPSASPIPSKMSDLENDVGYISETNLEDVTDEILAAAKASGDFAGDRGLSILSITTAPSSYTTTTGGFAPKYRVSYSTVLSQSKASNVKIGDTILCSYYLYPVGYVDSNYVYLGTRVSIRGADGTPGDTKFTYGTEDKTAGTSSLTTGHLYFVYE